MSATLVHRGPDSDGIFVDGPRRPRRAPARDHRPRDRRPADRERGRHGPRRPERRALQLPRAARRARARRPPLPHARRHRGARPPLRGAGHGLRASACAGCSRSRSGTRRARRLVLARDRYGIKPLYYRADGDGLAFASELRALPRGEIDLDALEAFLAFNSIPAPLTIFREVRKLPPGHVLVWEDGDVAARALRAARAGRRPTSCATTTRPSWSRSCARGCATRCGRTSSPTSRSACCSRAASTRRALAALAAQESRGAGAHVLDRLRGALVRRARRRAARRRALRHAPPRARAAARRGAAPARAGRGLRRAVRRLVGAADLPRLAARRRGREGRALRRGRRRALRRLLHLRRRPARASAPAALAAARAAARRAAAELDDAARASTTRRSASSAARTCRRSSATTPGRRSSRPTRAPS